MFYEGLTIEEERKGGMNGYIKGMAISDFQTSASYIRVTHNEKK
jgi:hypothetical protein